MEILKWIVAATGICDLHVYGSVASVIIHTSSSSPFSSLLPPCSLRFLLLFPLPSQPPTSSHLLHAAMSLLRSLWQGRHDAALVALRSQPDFWKHLTNPLFNELQLSEVEEANIEVCTMYFSYYTASWVIPVFSELVLLSKNLPQSHLRFHLAAKKVTFSFSDFTTSIIMLCSVGLTPVVQLIKSWVYRERACNS